MQNNRDVEFTPSTESGASGVGFNSAPTLGATVGTSGSPQNESDSRLGQATHKVQQMASQATEKTTRQFQSRLGQQKFQAASSLSSVAESLRSSSQQLEGQQNGMGRYIAQVADQVDNVASYLETHEVGEIVQEVERYARRAPAAFLGGAFAIGIIGARFLKSSRRTLTQQYQIRNNISNEGLTGRMRDPSFDSVGRPQAPGYAPPSVRADTRTGFNTQNSVDI